MTHKSLVDGFSDSYLKDTIEKEGRERQGTDTSGSGRKNWGWDGEKLGGEVCVCVCVGERSAAETRIAEAEMAFFYKC